MKRYVVTLYRQYLNKGGRIVLYSKEMAEAFMVVPSARLS